MTINLVTFGRQFLLDNYMCIFPNCGGLFDSILPIFGIQASVFLYPTATSAAFAAGILYYLFFVPQYFLVQDYETLSRTVKVATCLLHPMAMVWGVTTITIYEGSGEFRTDALIITICTYPYLVNILQLLTE